MDSATLDSLIAWIGAHPLAAGAVIFAVAFCDAIVILGFAVPAAPILFAVGALIGLGTLDPVYAISCAALGAFCGDGVSYALGHFHGDRLKRMWPFSRHPEWLQRGEAFFNRHGVKGIVIARYVGAVRPVVPAIAGMLGMRFRRYAAPSAFASITWALLFISPGWIFGASMDVVSAIAGRLTMVMLILVAILLAMYWLVDTAYGYFAPRASGYLERILAWSRRHPLMGRLSSALIDPKQPESASLALLGLGLMAASAGLIWLLFDVVGDGEPLRLDLAVHHAMLGLRTPFADHLMAGFSTLGDWASLGPACLAVFGWLLWRRRFSAAGHWIAAIGFGALATELMGRLLDVPRPPAGVAVAGFSFPSAEVTRAVLVYGFFAVLIARELPGRRRAWPYAAAAFLVTLLAFSRLYFGAHWISDVLAGLLLGMSWVTLLGIAYRGRIRRSFWMRPLALLFYSMLILAGSFNVWRNGEQALAAFEPPRTIRQIAIDDWWRHDWQTLDATRNDVSSARAWPLNLQYAGSLGALRHALIDDGWKEIPPPDWEALLRSLDPDTRASDLAPMAAIHAGRREVLLLVRDTEEENERLMLRLWPADVALQPAGPPLWYGVAARMRFTDRLHLLRLWRYGGDADMTSQLLQSHLPDWPGRRVRREGDRPEVLLLREP